MIDITQIIFDVEVDTRGGDLGFYFPTYTFVDDSLEIFGACILHDQEVQIKYGDEILQAIVDLKVHSNADGLYGIVIDVIVVHKEQFIESLKEFIGGY